MGDWTDFQAAWHTRLVLAGTEFCDHDEGHPLEPLPPSPHDEDGYCCWCGNGSWKFHAPWCEWADREWDDRQDDAAVAQAGLLGSVRRLWKRLMGLRGAL